MKLFSFFNRSNSAPVARERLQILLAHERRSACNSDLLALLHREVLDAISKHLSVDSDKVAVKLHRRDAMSMLEIDIELDPDAMPAHTGERAA
jgi:cell division topological specificity factor